MYSLHLTHPSAHTPGAVGVHPGRFGVRCLAQGSHPSRGQFLPCSDSNPQPRVTSPTLYPLEPQLPLCTEELNQGSSNLSLEVQSVAEFSSNPDQTHLPVNF